MKKSKIALELLFITILIFLLGTSIQAKSVGQYTQEDNYITRVLPNTLVTEFKNNLSTEGNVILKDRNGEIVEDDNIVKTGMTLEIGGAQYKVSVVGDINGDGKLSITDLVQCNLHTTNIKVLKGENVKSADINGDGNCTVTDLVQLNLVVANIKDITEYVKYPITEEKELLFGMPEEEYTEDGDEDKDGITNGEEETLGTNVNDADTDCDGLTDYYEVNVSKTDPLKADTDGDGINDGNEIALGLNPLAVDSKGDGINDSQRTLTYKTEDEKSGVDISITGKGNIASTTVDKLEKPESEQNNELLDTIYNFHTNGIMENAVITIKYSVETLEQKGLTEDNISLYYINEENNQLEKINSTVNKEDKTITATLEHFSMYIIGKKELNEFTFNSRCDSWVDIDGDGTVDEIVITNTGFDPKVNGFSFNNFPSDKSEGGNCYGMATFAMLYYIDQLPLKAEANTIWHFLTKYESERV